MFPRPNNLPGEAQRRFAGVLSEEEAAGQARRAESQATSHIGGNAPLQLEAVAASGRSLARRLRVF
jgi:hypothetical protein